MKENLASQTHLLYGRIRPFQSIHVYTYLIKKGRPFAFLYVHM